MNPINNVSGAASASPVQKAIAKPVHREVAADAPRQLPASDKLELSGVSHLLKALKASPEVRTDKVAAIRAQIEAGTYEDDKKLDAAVSRMLDDVLE